MIPDRRLEGPRRFVQPRLRQVPNHVGNQPLVVGPGERKSFAGGPVGLPAPLGVDPRDIFRGRAANRLVGGPGQASQRIKRFREGRVARLGPYPFAPLAVLRFEPLDLCTGGGLRETRQIVERPKHGHLVLIIQIRPSVAAFENEFAGRPASAEYVRNALEGSWSLAEARPHVPPPSLALGELGAGLHI